MTATEPILSKKHVKQLVAYYLRKGKLRNYLLVVLGLHTALRISDLLSLRWNDVYDFEYREFYTHIHLVERKTGKSKAIALNKQAIAALKLCSSVLGTDPKFFYSKATGKRYCHSPHTGMAHYS